MQGVGPLQRAASGAARVPASSCCWHSVGPPRRSLHSCRTCNATSPARTRRRRAATAVQTRNCTASAGRDGCWTGDSVTLRARAARLAVEAVPPQTRTQRHRRAPVRQAEAAQLRASVQTRRRQTRSSRAQSRRRWASVSQVRLFSTMLHAVSLTRCLVVHRCLARQPSSASQRFKPSADNVSSVVSAMMGRSATCPSACWTQVCE